MGRLTRFQAKPAHQEQFPKALSDYVSHALAKEENIHVEAYFEQDNPSVLWLIERWKNSNELDRFASSPQAITIQSLKLEALSTNTEICRPVESDLLRKKSNLPTHRQRCLKSRKVTAKRTR